MNREKILKNAFAFNELLHKKDIDEKLRSQFVGTILLYIKDIVANKGATSIDDELQKEIKNDLLKMTSKQIVADIECTLDKLLDGSDDKNKKVELLQKNVLQNRKIEALQVTDWVEIIDTLLMNIYKYINTNSSGGQDILSLFFITFNKYAGKADKNQVFTPDYIVDFMCRITEISHTKRVLDGTCGSGSILVQAMAKELADCKKGHTAEEINKLQDKVKKENIYGIEIEEKAYGLSVTNMMIYGDCNSNIKLGSCFDCKEFIKKSDPDVILLNPPYNANLIGIPATYKSKWEKSVNGKEDPTKGLVFVHYFSDVIKELNAEKIAKGDKPKTVKLAVLLPLACAIGSGSLIATEKKALLEDNTLDAVFSLSPKTFYPMGAVNVCCMVFTLGQPHIKLGGTARSTFFGYCKEDGFVTKKKLGRVERFDKNGNSIWKAIEEEWLDLYEKKAVVDGKSAVENVDADAEWLCEAYMKTDYNKLTVDDFQRTLIDYLVYLLREGNVYEPIGSSIDGDA